MVGLTDVRARRDTDWAMDSLKGMLVDDEGEPLAFFVNPQPFSIEMCGVCKVCYEPKEYKALAKNADEKRICVCGSIDWVSHFATFPETLVAPMILSGTSERGCCSACGAPWERILDKTFVGDWSKSKGKGAHKPGDVATMDAWTKRKTRPSDPEFSAKKLLDNTYAARARTSSHDNPFPKPVTVGWRPTCSHPLFPADVGPCVVLDPFSGSGRTGLTAMRMGRSYIGIEMNPDYIVMANWLAQKQKKAAEPAPSVGRGPEPPESIEVANA